MTVGVRVSVSERNMLGPAQIMPVGLGDLTRPVQAWFFGGTTSIRISLSLGFLNCNIGGGEGDARGR